MTLFVAKGSDNVSDVLYALGTGVGGVIAARSLDFGVTWNTSLVAQGYWSGGGTPVLRHNGMLYRALEIDKAGYFPFPQSKQASLLWAREGTDLLDTSSWHSAPPLEFNREWITSPWDKFNWASPGFLEGNPVISPDGNIVNVLRVNSLPYANVGLILTFNGSHLEFTKMIGFPGGMSKFDIRLNQSRSSNVYVSVANNVVHDYCPSARNNLSMTISNDLVTWNIKKVLIEDDSGLSELDSMRYTGFHYVSWQFDADMPNVIHCLVRTAYRGSNSYHNSNRVTYKNFSVDL